MKILKQLVRKKAFTLVVLLMAVLGGSLVSASTFDSSSYESPVLLKVDTDAGHHHLKPYVPTQNRHAEQQTETEIRAEEEDNTEKDDGEVTFGLLYEFNPTWVKVWVRPGRPLIRIVGTNALYILYHSWKSFLI